MTTSTITDRIVRLYVDGDASALDGLYDADAVIDVNVPRWRYQLRGVEEISAAVRDDELGVADRHVPWSRSGTTDEGVYLEMEVRFVQGGEPAMWRIVHLFRLDDDRIAEHTCYCSGIWTAADVRRYEGDHRDLVHHASVDSAQADAGVGGPRP